MNCHDNEAFLLLHLILQDDRFCSPIIFPKFEVPPKQVIEQSDAESKNTSGFKSTFRRDQIKDTDRRQEWLAQVISLESSLRSLLRLPYHRFWATVNHNICVQVALESYLRNGPRFFDVCNASHQRGYSIVNDAVIATQLSAVHTLVLMTFLRITRLKENEVQKYTFVSNLKQFYFNTNINSSLLFR